MINKNTFIKKISLPILLCFLLIGCGTDPGEEKLSIVCTNFPAYDWVREILEEKAEDWSITWLGENGVDMHSYQPSAADVANIIEADIVIYVGGVSEEWVSKTLEQSGNEQQITINMLDVVGERVLTEEIVEGMEHPSPTEEQTAEEAEHPGTTHQESEGEPDEHVWLSFENAKMICEEIVASVSSVDAGNAAFYQQNAEEYLERLNELQDQYALVRDLANTEVLLFADRFPFRYMTQEWSLDYYAAFPGCFAETEAGFETIIFLSEKIEELALEEVIVIENSNSSIAETVIENTTNQNQVILTMNSMQSVTIEDAENGATYLNIMEENLEVLQEALD